MNHHPKMWFTFFPHIVKCFVKYKLGKMPNYRLQRELFKYLMLVDDFDVQIERFWDKNRNRIAPWYLEQKRSDDLIISASPTCIIKPIANRLGVRCMATEFDRKHGVFLKKREKGDSPLWLTFGFGYKGDRPLSPGWRIRLCLVGNK